MNTLNCQVDQIERVDCVHLVTLSYENITLKMLNLELPNLKTSQKVKLIVKPTHVSIAKQLQANCSIENIFKGKVVDMERGKLLCNIKLKVHNTLIEALITKESFALMDIKLNDMVDVLIKASSLSILEVLDD